MRLKEINLGDTVARSSKGASTGRTGQVIELDGNRARVHWTKKSNGQPMSERNWINVGELMVVAPSETLKPCTMQMKFELGNNGIQVTLVLDAKEFEVVKKCIGSGLFDSQLTMQEIELATAMAERLEKVKVEP